MFFSFSSVLSLGLGFVRLEYRITPLLPGLFKNASAFLDAHNDKTARTTYGLFLFHNNPLIVRLLAQAGTFLLRGVAAASSILCISTALNKRKFILFNF